MTTSSQQPSSVLPPWEGRAILLLDLDAFFASVEQLDHPEWRGKPVIVGGDAERHGVVSTCSYEARAYGVRSAMPASTAKRLCPDAIWTMGNFDRYREVSSMVMAKIVRETPSIQQVSIDEAFADITPTRANREHPVQIVERIQKAVNEIGVTCSIGLGTSKSVAKIASDLDKPNGLTVVYPGMERSFLSNLPIKVLSGVGPRSQERLIKEGITTLGQIADAPDEVLESIFGKTAHVMRARAMGTDDSLVHADRERKSVSHELTFAELLTTKEDVITALESLLPRIGRRLRKKDLKASTLALKMRFEDRSVRSAQIKLPFPSNDDIAFSAYIAELVEKLWYEGARVRLVGFRASGFHADAPLQQALIDTEEDRERETPLSALLAKDDDSRARLLSATDAIKDKFGEKGVVFGSELKTSDKGTGSGTRTITDN